MPSPLPVPSILIVEDDPQLGNNMALILNLEGFEVRLAPNGRIGLEMIKERPPDLILCDILMPEMDGHTFHAAIKQQPAWAGILFIFVSALNNQQHIRQGMLAGADDYLPKPFSAEELLVAVHVRLQRHRTLQARENGSAGSANGLPTEKALLLRRISRREQEVLLLVAQGATTKEIGNLLCISHKTVEFHRAQLMKKLGATNAATLAHWASLLNQQQHDVPCGNKNGKNSPPAGAQWYDPTDPTNLP